MKETLMDVNQLVSFMFIKLKAFIILAFVYKSSRLNSCMQNTKNGPVNMLWIEEFGLYTSQRVQSLEETG